jgi:hypothetical protein
MSKKIVCSIAPLKNNERRGTAQECLEKGMVKYWGLHVVPKKELDKFNNISRSKKSKKSKGKKEEELNIVFKRKMSLQGRIKKLAEKIKYEKSTKKVKEFKEEYIELVQRFKNMVKELAALKKEVENYD